MSFWNQVNPKFPNQLLKLYEPGTDSGTFDYFTEAVNRKAKASHTDYTSTANPNVLQLVGENAQLKSTHVLIPGCRYTP